MFKDKKLREEHALLLSELRELGLLDNGNTYDYKAKYAISEIKEIRRDIGNLPSRLEKANKRIADLEYKLSALIELLGVKEEPEKTKGKMLVKGKKKVEIKRTKEIIWNPRGLSNLGGGS